MTLSDDDHLFQLIRGVPTVMISRGGEEGVDYKPLKPKSISSVDTDRDEMKKNPITSRSQAWKRESPVDFVVTLMMTSDGNEPPDCGGTCKYCLVAQARIASSRKLGVRFIIGGFVFKRLKWVNRGTSKVLRSIKFFCRSIKFFCRSIKFFCRSIKFT